MRGWGRAWRAAQRPSLGTAQSGQPTQPAGSAIHGHMTYVWQLHIYVISHCYFYKLQELVRSVSAWPVQITQFRSKRWCRGTGRAGRRADSSGPRCSWSLTAARRSGLCQKNSNSKQRQHRDALSPGTECRSKKLNPNLEV